MNLGPTDIAADWALFDNVEDLLLYNFNPLEDALLAPIPVKGIVVEIGESAGLTSAYVEASDETFLDGRITQILINYPVVNKFSQVERTLNGVTQRFIVNISTKKAWQTYSELSCRDA